MSERRKYRAQVL